MSKGISLHIGVNHVDDTHYRKNIFEGWKGELSGCEADAIAMETIAKSQGFETTQLLTTEATRANVKKHILSAAENLEAGDYFFLSYSGHGSQVKDLSMDERLGNDSSGEERDRWDETWCLHDAQLLDDELFELWRQFKADVRILIFSDSCHSGTVTRGDNDEEEILPPPGMAFRLIPKPSLTATYMVHKAFYDGLQAAPGMHPKIAARVLLFSGCQDEQLSREDQSSDPPGGLFTKSILKAWAPGKFNTYKDFFDAVKTGMPDDKQTPNFSVFGGGGSGFEGREPLVI